MNIKIISASVATHQLFSQHAYIKADLWFPTLFGGDRISCCDEAVVVEVSGTIVALATIAPEGEMTSGVPTIVGLYTVRGHRKSGYARLAFEAAVKRGIERGFTKIRVDTLSKGALRITKTMPMELSQVLEVGLQILLCGFLE